MERIRVRREHDREPTTGQVAGYSEGSVPNSTFPLMHPQKFPIPLPARLFVVWAVAIFSQIIHAEPSGETPVYHVAGKNRVHVEDCKRPTQDSSKRAKLAEMTLTEAKAKGLELCTKCPGGTASGKEKPDEGVGGLDSRSAPRVVGNQTKKEPLKVLFEDSLHDDWQEKWFLDGKMATLEHREGGLYFAGGTVTKEDNPEGYHAHHAVLWTKRVFEGDIRISYQMKQVDESGYGNTLLYIQAQGIGMPPHVEDIHEWRDLREVPDMSKYFTYMDLLSLSLRENIRCKRYPWRDEKLEWYPTQGLIEPMVDYPGLIPGEIYQVVVDKKSDSLRLRLYGESGAKLHVDHTWDTRKIAGGIEPRRIQKGRIGIRHMATKQSV